MALQGIDISEFQGTVNFASVKTSIHSGFVYAKATEGMSITDAKYTEYHAGAKVNGIPFGAYHFFHFGTSPQAQADHFLHRTAGYEGELVPMVDVEAASMPHAGMGARECVGRLGVFLDILEGRLHGKRCLLYTGYSFWNDVMGGSDSFSGHQAWIAAYNLDASPPIPTGFKTWTVWQHTSSGTVPGIGTSVDLDTLNAASVLPISRAGH